MLRWLLIPFALLAACGSNGATVADPELMPVPDTAVTRLLSGPVEGFLLVGDDVILVRESDPNIGCSLSILETPDERFNANVPADAVLYDACRGNSYDIMGRRLTGPDGGQDLEPLPIYIENDIVYLDITPNN